MAISHLNNNAAPPILSEPGSAVAEGVHPVPSAASGKQKSYAGQAGPPVGSDQRPPCASSTIMGHVPQRVGHDGCPVGSPIWIRTISTWKISHASGAAYFQP